MSRMPLSPFKTLALIAFVFGLFDGLEGRITCATVDGNSNIVKTFRPITAFEHITFGERDIETNSNYNMIMTMPVDVFIFLNEDDENEQLSIETDQNLQRFFQVESDGHHLRVKLDSYDLSKYIASAYMPFALRNAANEIHKNGINFINSTRTRVEIRTRKPHVYLNKYNFGKLQIFLEPDSRMPAKMNARAKSLISNSTLHLNCNGSLMIDGIRVDDVRKVHGSNLLSNYLSVYMCDESYNLFLSQTRGFSEFVASRDRESFRQQVNAILSPAKPKFQRIKLSKLIF